MKKIFLMFIITGLFFYSCGSAEQMQQDEGTSPVEEETSEGTKPSWYNHASRSHHDSTEFAGTGMAIATDSLVAAEKSIEQAQKHLLYAVDSYTEEVRRNLTDGDPGSNLGSASFVLSLRQAVKNLQIPESDLTIETVHSSPDGPVHHAYSRISLSRDRAIEKVASEVDHDLFSRSLREEPGM